MLRLPGKYDKKWFVILGIIFIFTLGLFLIFKLILQIGISGRNIVGFAILSTLVSLVVTTGGFLGFRIYFCISTASNVLGLLYMLYIAVKQSAPGWTDLVAIMAYIFLMGIGILGGIVVEVLVRLVKKYNKQ